MNTKGRCALGVLLIIAAAATVAVGYAKAPTESTCQLSNSLNQGLGLGATCSTTPPMGYFVAGALLVAAGLLVIVPWWRRLVAD